MSGDDTTSVVRTYATRRAAEFSQALLESSGIPSFIRADDAGGMWPDLGRATGVRLMVTTGDLERAEDILEESEGRAAEHPVPGGGGTAPERGTL